MSNLLPVAQGVDVLPLLMAIERQVAIFAEAPRVELFQGGEWRGEFFAFPQLRGVLLDILRRVECGVLEEVVLLKVEGQATLARLEDATKALVVLGLAPMHCHCGKDTAGLEAGSVVWCSGAEEVELVPPHGGCAVVVSFSPMP